MPPDKDFSPHVNDTPTRDQLAELRSAFPSFTEEEARADWAREYRIAVAFAAEHDLYRAITGFKRARVLLGTTSLERRKQIDYAIILSYYLGQRFLEVVETFENSQLVSVKPDFPAFANLLIILEDTYHRLGEGPELEKLRTLLQMYSPELAETMAISHWIRDGEIEALTALENEPVIEDALGLYHARKKHVGKAKMLQAVLPGAGYYYVGQKKAALTSFVINALFGWATYQLFHEDQIAAGVIVASLEVGWYIGGINGAGIEAVEYNERLYEPLAGRMLQEGRFFPVLQFNTVF